MLLQSFFFLVLTANLCVFELLNYPVGLLKKKKKKTNSVGIFKELRDPKIEGRINLKARPRYFLLFLLICESFPTILSHSKINY